MSPINVGRRVGARRGGVIAAARVTSRLTIAIPQPIARGRLAYPRTLFSHESLEEEWRAPPNLAPVVSSCRSANCSSCSRRSSAGVVHKDWTS